MRSKQLQLNSKVGLYMRLSKDDERAGESLSIENQRIILTKYAQERGWTITDEYIDDGYSGTNFDRPEVQRLLEDAKTGKIDTIIVKDLSLPFICLRNSASRIKSRTKTCGRIAYCGAFSKTPCTSGIWCDCAIRPYHTKTSGA